MTVQITTNLTSSIRAQYVADYNDKIFALRLYDQIAKPIDGISPEQAIQGSSVVVPYLSSMAPGTAAISQTADMTPQILYDATASATPVSRGEALQWAENLDIQAYTDYAQARVAKLGENAAESIELLANYAATTGTYIERAAARADLDAGTASHRASDSIFRKLHAQMLTQRIPGFINDAGEANTWVAIMHPYAFHDISESGNIDAIGIYQDKGIHLNFELAQVGAFRLVVSPGAKTFFGAGADNATAVASTNQTDSTPLATIFTCATDVSTGFALGVDQPWTFGTEETANVHYPSNEQVILTVLPSSLCTGFVGQGENGGFRFAHVATTPIRNADSVYTIVFGGPESLYKLYAPSVGEFGEVVGPKTSGLAEQFSSIAWKFYGQYGRLTENLVLRAEVSTSYEA